MNRPTILILGLLAIIAVVTFLIFLARWWQRRRIFAELKPYPDSRFVDLDGHYYHFRQAGRGQDVVLLHGIGASIYIWRFIFDQLAAHYRVTAIDLLGFGASDKPTDLDLGLDPQSERLHKLMQKLKLTNPMLVGSSMGGTLALWLLHRYPKSYFGAVVMAPATNPKLVKPQFKALIPVGKRLYKSLNAAVMSLFLRMVVADRRLITPEAIAAYLRPYQDSGQAVSCFFAAVELLTDPRLPQQLGGIRQPVHILWGRKDRLVHRKTMDELREILPKASWREHAKAGHHMMEDHPDWSLEEINNFIHASGFADPSTF